MLGSNVGSYSLPFVLETGAKYIAAGCTNSVVVKTDGTVTIRGKSEYLPNAEVSTITGVVKAAVDWCHFLLLKEDGTVLSWGYYDNSSAARNMTPFVYEGATNVVDVYAGSPFCVLLKSDNTCVSVVNPYYGDYVSKDVTDLTVQLRTADGYLEQMFNVATDGSVTARGYNDYNQLGIDKSMTGLFMPELTLVPYLSDVVKISTSQDHALALCEDGTVWTWGL